MADTTQASQPLRLPPIDQNDPTPKYLQARGILVDAIRSGTLVPGMKLPSTKEISALINISLITAHKALEGLVESGWLRREVGRGTFVRDDVDLGRSTQRVLSIGLLMENHVSIGDYYHGTIINALRRCAAEDSRRVEFFFHDRFDLRDKNHSAVGAICIHPTAEARSQVERLARKHPVVILGGQYDDLNVATVDCANAAGSRASVEHLLELGHERFLLLAGPQNLSNSRDRADGARTALAAHGVTLTAHDVIASADAIVLDDASTAALTERLRGDDRPTAVVAGGFYLALSVMHVIRGLGLEIPDDVSVVGFDDPASAALLNPPLTTVRQPLEQMAERAYQAICAAVHDRQTPTERHELPAELIVRQSTGPAAKR